MIMRIITHGAFQKLDLAPVLRQFFEEEHLVHIVTCQSIWGRHQHPCKGADSGAVSQPILDWTVELGPAVAIIPIDVLLRHMPVGLGRDMFKQAGDLLGNRLLLVLRLVETRT